MLHEYLTRLISLYYNLLIMIYPVTIDLVRHGTTAYNEADRMQGQIDIPLSDRGRREIEALAERLRDVAYDLVVHSPLKRAEETARIIAGHRRGVRWQVYPEFTEIDLGRWEGQIYSETVAREAEFYQRWLTDEHCPVPEGESFFQVSRRAKAGVDRLWQEKAQTVLICGHATVNRGILASLVDLPLNLARRFRMKNGGWSRFVVTEQGGLSRTLIEHWNA